LNGWLIDTNVVSELRRARPSQKVRAFVASQPGDVLFTSEVTFAEIRFGIEKMANPVRRADVAQWLEGTLRPLFAGRVLPVTEDALLRWRLMPEAGRKAGHTFSEPDLLVAALAALADLIVVSRAITEFIAAGVPVFDPWNWMLHVGGRAFQVDEADGPDALAKTTALIGRSPRRAQ
jgi:toxin FitB